MMDAYYRYLRAERRAWAEGNDRRALMLARMKARAYSMYAVDTPYF